MAKNSSVLSFSPKVVSVRLLKVLPERARDVLTNRFGLSADSKKFTLDAIGKRYHITRERVRQIENYAIASIRKSDIYKKEKSVFAELEKALHAFGGVAGEEELLTHLGGSDVNSRNCAHFLLALGENFKKIKEDDNFKHRWHMDEKLAEKVHSALKKLYDNLSEKDLVSELDIIAQFLTHIEDLDEHYKQDHIVRRWLGLSKLLGKNPLGEWGRAASPNVKMKGIRDYAFLVIRKHGSPIHFTEVARAIEKNFGRKAHVATTHNELIKDKRFVLVGRGLYALTEWGYMAGVVRDVIAKILEKHGPLTKKEIFDKVLKERYVKENTISVNLQNKKHFKKDQKTGKYSPVK
jgi:DNA-directed RNA polymerase delta subunit